MKIVTGVRTDVGRVRQGNEDAYLLHAPLYGVADGMGGHVAGDVASRTAVETIEAHADGVTPEDLPELVRAANRAIRELAERDPALHGMGTTCTLVLIDGSTAHLAHVGDSRAYLLRGDDLTQVTEDHTLVQRMVREGRISQEEAGHHPQRNIITRSLGVDDDVQVDTFTLELAPGDRLLLASDGLTSMVGTDQIKALLADGDDPQAQADALVEAANAAGGEDNITVVVLHAIENGASETGPVHATAPPPPPEPASAPEARGGVRWSRRLLVTAVVLAALVGAGVAAARWALGNSYFVGLSADGSVTIYRGIPETIAGLKLSSVEQETTLNADELPAYARDDLEQGIKVSSLAEARATLDDLEQLSRDFARRTRRAGGG
jgi:protein phosphatase